MIQMQTRLTVADNSGAKEVMCIKVLGGSGRQFASVGDVVVASVKKSQPGADITTGTVVRGVIVRTRQRVRRKDGSYVKFDGNALCLVTTITIRVVRVSLVQWLVNFASVTS